MWLFFSTKKEPIMKFYQKNTKIYHWLSYAGLSYRKKKGSAEKVSDIIIYSGNLEVLNGHRLSAMNYRALNNN